MGTSTSSKPESCVEVVVARIKFGFAGAATGASVGASVATGASVTTGASVPSGDDIAGAVVGVADPQADNARDRKTSRVNKMLKCLSRISLSF
jgi:hypothetical protein